MKSDFTLTLGYLNPALNNLTQISRLVSSKKIKLQVNERLRSHYVANKLYFKRKQQQQKIQNLKAVW